jgi:hypothetical protein
LQRNHPTSSVIALDLALTGLGGLLDRSDSVTVLPDLDSLPRPLVAAVMSEYRRAFGLRVRIVQGHVVFQDDR